MRCRKSAPSADFMATELQVIESGARRNLRDWFAQPPAFYNKGNKAQRYQIAPKVTQLPGAGIRGQMYCILWSVNAS